MRITNDVDVKVGLGSDYTKDTVGIVFKTQEMYNGEPKLGLIIPKFMLGYTMNKGDQPNETDIEVTGKKCLNKDKYFNSSVKMKNYIPAYPKLNQNQSMPVYTQGDKVDVCIIDNDIKTIAFLPYGINRLGQRKTDKLTFAVPDNKKENTELTDANTYFIRIDSINKQIILSTTNTDGEIASQTLILNSKDGIIQLSDGQDRLITMDTQNDNITVSTSGAFVELSEDKVNLFGDSITIKGTTEVNINTDTLNIEASTIKSKGDDVKYEYEQFKQSGSTAEYEVDNEKHKGSSMELKYDTYHNDTPTVGINGEVIMPNFTIGKCPDINQPVTPTNGISGQSGSMSLQTDPSGVPLVKWPQLMPILIGIATTADGCPYSPKGAMAALSAGQSQVATTKIMAS